MPLLQQGAGASQYVIAAFASVAANRGTAALGGALPTLVQRPDCYKKAGGFCCDG